MGWFDQQIHERKENDARILSDSYEAAVSSVTGAGYTFAASEDVLNQILSYYHLSSVKIPDLKDDDDKISAVCHVSGLMHRKVLLKSGWYKDAFGAFIARLKDDGRLVALVPDKLGHYSFYDEKSGTVVKLNSKTETLLESDAVCFYKPLPAKKLTATDLLKFGASSCSATDTAFIILLLAISTLLGLVLPKISYFLFTDSVTGGSISLLVSTIVFMAGVSITKLLIEAARKLLVTRVGVKMDAAVRCSTMMRILNLPVGFFRQHTSGEIMQRLNYLDSVCSEFCEMFFTTVLTGLFSLLYITQIFAYAKVLVIPSVCIIFTQCLFSLIVMFTQVRLSQKRMEITAKNSGTSLSMISGVQKIKLSGSEKRMFARWLDAFAEETRISYNPPLLIKINTGITLAISLAGQFLIYFIASGSGMQAAEYYAFQTAFTVVSGAVASFAEIATTVANIKPSLEMAKPILETLPETNEKAKELTALRGNIEINNVSFRYNTNMPYVLNDFSLNIKHGQYIAIVGKTGCGKSTLIRLLLGFEKPERGAIFYDNTDLNQIEKKTLRRMIGIVMQDDNVFMGDIYSNIVISNPRLTLDDAWEAAEIAGIADDIRNMPMGMNTLISDGQGGISGGQRQRLMIARAIAPKPKILIFDEATSALDNITQKKVSDALDKLDCTRIVIAHRLSTIQNCDRILYMQDGRITEDGTYDELIAANGEFARLVERQRLDI